jgi:intracellular sulfur oxidation DsrE/DsrF family protein
VIFRKAVLFIAVVAAGLLAVSLSAKAGTIDDSDALRNVREAKGLFDVSVSDAKSLEFYLTVIERTYDGLVSQGQRPDLVVAFRGPTVRLINTEVWSFSEEDQEILKRLPAALGRLREKGVRFEACSVATGLFKVDNTTILPDIRVVGNTFISLIGYQAQGYGLVPIKN